MWKNGYHLSHWILGALAALLAGVGLFQDRPWGWPIAVAGIVVIALAIGFSRLQWPPLTVVALMVLFVAVAPFWPLLDHPIVRYGVWALAALGSGFLTVNLLYDTPAIHREYMSALIVTMGLAFLGAMFAQVFPLWLICLAAGPAFPMAYPAMCLTRELHSSKAR